MCIKKNFSTYPTQGILNDTHRKIRMSKKSEKKGSHAVRDPHVAGGSTKGKRLNPFEHALLRPDAYIGSIKTSMIEMFTYREPIVSTDDSDASDEDSDEDVVIDDDGDEIAGSKKAASRKIDVKVEKRLTRYNPGLFKLFGEAISNAIDNLWRSQKNKTKMTWIKVTVDADPESETFGWITMSNDGFCIPVEKQNFEYNDFRSGKTVSEDLYPAEVYFGEMLAGTNFEDDDTRKTSGKNGMGSKCLVIFSKEFRVDHTSPISGKRFRQTYTNHGVSRTPPKITSYSGKTGYTTVSFLPDYEDYFGYEGGMDRDLFCLIKKSCYECAMITKLAVSLNGEKIVIKSLANYVRMFYPSAKDNHMNSFVAPNGDECILVEKTTENITSSSDDVDQVSWINGINTRDGGIHVGAWKDLIFPMIVKEYNKKAGSKGQKTSAKDLYPYFTLFVRAECAGAGFVHQTKDQLTSIKRKDVKDDGYRLFEEKEREAFRKEISLVIPKLLKWNFVKSLKEKLDTLREVADAKKDSATGKGKKLAFGKKGRDANWAGKQKYKHLTVGTIAEGLSAKSLTDSLAGYMEGGNDAWGSFAIQGKFINVVTNSAKKVRENKEVQILKQFFGLVTGVDYSVEENRKLLRYGKILLMTDQDDDGLHIRALLILFLYSGWPQLFRLKAHDGTPYIQSFTTAVVIATKGTKEDAKVKLFFSNPEYERWASNPENVKGWTIKYMKGLGSHKPGQERLYSDDPKQIGYILDGKRDAEMMALAFDDSVENRDWRKRWMCEDLIKPGTTPTTEEAELIYKTFVTEGNMTLPDFVNQQLKIFVLMTLGRAIARVSDGMNESQRKILYAIMQTPKLRKGTLDLEKVTGIVKEISGYHHGGASLEGAIKVMASGYPGSNNIPLLKNDGRFPTRMSGMDDAASGRYVFTGLEAITSKIFRVEDEPVLERAMSDNVPVEYKTFIPVICMLLVNGHEGMASGFSQTIANYDPVEQVAWIKKWIAARAKGRSVTAEPLKPFYRGFKGEIILLAGDSKEGYVEYDPETHKRPTAWKSKGIIHKSDRSGAASGEWWDIEEIPVKMKIARMKITLEAMYTGRPENENGKKNKKVDPVIAEIRDLCTPQTPKWEIKTAKDFKPDIETNMKCLQANYSLGNMHALDVNGYPVKFSKAEDILELFCPLRYEYYEKRKAYWTEQYKRDLKKEKNRLKYVKAVVEKKLDMNQHDAPLTKAMLKLGLVMLTRDKKTEKGESSEEEGDEMKGDDTEEDSVQSHEEKKSFDYLLSMQMRSLTTRKISEIEIRVAALKKKLEDYESTSVEKMWNRELDEFLEAHAEFLTTRKEEGKPKKTRARKAAKAIAKKK